MWKACDACLSTGRQRTLNDTEVTCSACRGRGGWDEAGRNEGGFSPEGPVRFGPLVGLLIGGYLWLQTGSWLVVLAGGLASAWFAETKIGRVLVGVAACLLILWVLAGLGVI